MNHRRNIRWAVVPVAAALIFSASTVSGPGVRPAHAFGVNDLAMPLRGHVSGFASFELDSANRDTAAKQPRNYFPRANDGCAVNLGSNTKINQNCLNVTDADLQGRGQAQNETSIAQDPNQQNHLVASYNDYRRGDGNCYTAYSTDGAKTWNDSTVPMSFTRGNPTFGAPREYWQAGGDTSVAWDSKGNAYLSCQVFNRGSAVSPNQDQSNALLVFRSTQNGGASWNFPGRYVTTANDVAGTGALLEDKQLMTVDNNATSCPVNTPEPRTCTPFQDRIYVTWTEFTATTAYIYEAFSADYGQTFSPRHLLSPATTNPACPIPVTAGKGCDSNQFSQPFVSPDGTVNVVWANFNTVDLAAPKPGPARYQVLISKSVDGGNTFTAPRKVSDYYELPDCATYQGGQSPGRACVPEKGSTTNSVFRASNYPVGVVNPGRPTEIAVSIGSYINVHSNEANGCVPTGADPISQGGLYTGVKTPGACNNDILLSISNDGGATFTGAKADPRTEETVTQAPGQATTDQWFQWMTYNKSGKLAVSYYDRQFGTDETTGFSDFSLSGSDDSAKFAVKRVTSGSMPFPTQFAGGFWGDYTGLSAISNAFPTWSDTRPPDLFVCPGTATASSPPAVCSGQDPSGIASNDQDAFVAAEVIPAK